MIILGSEAVRYYKKVIAKTVKFIMVSLLIQRSHQGVSSEKQNLVRYVYSNGTWKGGIVGESSEEKTTERQSSEEKDISGLVCASSRCRPATKRNPGICCSMPLIWYRPPLDAAYRGGGPFDIIWHRPEGE